MVLLILGIILAIVAFCCLGIKVEKAVGTNKYGNTEYDNVSFMKMPIRLILSLVILCIFLIISSISIVPTGNTGVVVTFGRVEDYTLDSGIHFIAPWRSVIKMDNRTQICTSELSCFSSVIQEVKVVYSVNYQISKDNAQTIYRTIGAGYLETVMTPKIQESVKGVIAKYNAEKLVEQRGTLSTQIEEVLTANLIPYNIEVVSTSIADIDFTDAFTNAVEAKQVAEQNKLKAQTEQEQAVIEAKAAAERQVIKAQADADASILAAEADKQVQQINADAAEYAGQKEAAILSNIGEQMTKYPGLERYYYYQAWNGILPETMLGSGTDIIMDMRTSEVTPVPTSIPKEETSNNE